MKRLGTACLAALVFISLNPAASQAYPRPMMQGRYRMHCVRTRGTTFNNGYRTTFIAHPINVSSIRMDNDYWGKRVFHRASERTFGHSYFRTADAWKLRIRVHLQKLDGQRVARRLTAKELWKRRHTGRDTFRCSGPRL